MIYKELSLASSLHQKFIIHRDRFDSVDKKEQNFEQNIINFKMDFLECVF